MEGAVNNSVEGIVAECGGACMCATCHVLSQGFDLAITRGVPGNDKFSVLYFKNNQLIGVDSINRPLDHMAARKLLAAGMRVTPEQAADPNIELKSLV